MPILLKVKNETAARKEEMYGFEMFVYDPDGVTVLSCGSWETQRDAQMIATGLCRVFSVEGLNGAMRELYKLKENGHAQYFTMEVKR